MAIKACYFVLIELVLLLYVLVGSSGNILCLTSVKTFIFYSNPYDYKQMIAVLVWNLWHSGWQDGNEAKPSEEGDCMFVS